MKSKKPHTRHRLPLLLPLFLLSIISGLSGCQDTSQKNITLWPLQTQCNLHKSACTQTKNGQTASINITPHPITVARPLGIQVTLKNFNEDKVFIDISGTNMYMGYNRVALMRRDAQHPHQWIGTSMLAFCTNNKMDWQISLMIFKKDGKQIQIPYPLTTYRQK